jgi:hypothetical protein
MVVQCDFKFDDPEGVFLAGSVISGEIQLSVPDKFKVTGIDLVLEGFVKVKWEEYKEKINLTFEDREQHLSEIIKLVPIELEYPEGKYSYRFKRHLPTGLPSTVDEKYGHTTYSASVIIHRSWKPDMKFTSKFTIVQAVDLNWDSSLKLPYQNEIEKTFGCFFCKTRPISLMVRIPMQGFYIGQIFDVSIDLRNPTQLEIHHVNVSLVKKIDYQVDYPFQNFKKDVIVVKTVKIGDRLKDETNEFDVPFEIPEKLPESCIMGNSRIFNIYYEIHVKATVSFFQKLF